MASWTTPEDIKSRWIGANKPTDDTMLQMRIDDVEIQILAFFPLIQERIDEGSVDVRIIKVIVANKIIRFLKSGGENVASFSQTAGPYTNMQSYRASDSEQGSNGIIVTATDVAALRPKDVLESEGNIDLIPYVNVEHDDFHFDMLGWRHCGYLRW